LIPIVLNSGKVAVMDPTFVSRLRRAQMVLRVWAAEAEDLYRAMEKRPTMRGSIGDKREAQMLKEASKQLARIEQEPTRAAAEKYLAWMIRDFLAVLDTRQDQLGRAGRDPLLWTLDGDGAAAFLRKEVHVYRQVVTILSEFLLEEPNPLRIRRQDGGRQAGSQ
jgi:hypothetical protein